MLVTTGQREGVTNNMNSLRSDTKARFAMAGLFGREEDEDGQGLVPRQTKRFLTMQLANMGMCRMQPPPTSERSSQASASWRQPVAFQNF